MTTRRLGMVGLAALVAAAMLLPHPPVVALATTLGYAKVIGGSTASNFAAGHGIAVETSGKAHVTGRFEGTIDVNPGAGVFPLTSNGANISSYSVRLDASGDFLGSNDRIDGDDDDFSAAVVVDGGGASYVTGVYRDAAATNGRNQAYVIKLDPNGSTVWVRYFGGTGEASGGGVAVDGSGAVYVTGTFSGVIDFDPNGGTTDLTSAGFGDVFAVKLNSSGALVWAKQIGGGDSDTDADIVVDGAGAAYLTGSFEGAADFDPGVGTVELVAPGGARDAFAVKLDTSGELVWAKQFGGTAIDDGFKIAVDGAGAVYLTGWFALTADFDPSPDSTFNLVSAGIFDAFAVKLNSSGALVWAKQFGSTDYDSGSGITVDGAGNVYVTGAFAGTADFDPSPSGAFNLTSAGDADAFVVKLDATGAYVWAERLGGAGYESGAGVVVDGSGNVYLTGGFAGTADFDPSSSGTVNLTSNSGDPSQSAAFVVKLVQATAPVNALPASQPLAEHTTPLVFSTARGNRISIADTDNGSSPLRVTLSVNSGALSLATTAGLSFSGGDGTADATMTFSGTLTAINTALDGLTFTPVAGGPFSASLQVTTLDLLGPSGGQTDTDTLAIRVGRRPTANDDSSYAVNTGAVLNVPVGSGLLANDTDTDTPAAELRAVIATAPTRGTAALQPDGSFTYTPKGNEGGADTFTYRVTDSTGLNATGTATITITGVVCGPRPTVTVTTAIADGALQATLTATATGAPTQNRLQSITFGTLQNAQVTLNGAAISNNQVVALPASTTTQTFTVRRAAGGQATTVPLTVTDGCGSWPTFVGGGASAGF